MKIGRVHRTTFCKRSSPRHAGDPLVMLLHATPYLPMSSHPILPHPILPHPILRIRSFFTAARRRYFPERIFHSPGWASGVMVRDNMFS
jgi:hypothetical protein